MRLLMPREAVPRHPPLGRATTRASLGGIALAASGLACSTLLGTGAAAGPFTPR